MLFLVLLLVTISASEKRDTYDDDSIVIDACIDDESAVKIFRESIDSFAAILSVKAASKGQYFLTISPLETWITVAAIAEGAEDAMRQDLFSLLKLPEDLCSRQLIYQRATTRTTSNHFVSITHTRALIIDEGSIINPHWYNLVQQNSLLQVISAPLKYDPITTTEIIKHTLSSDTQKLKLSGNSVIVNSIDYNGLWTTAFDDAIVRRAPFYSQTGVKIGAVDLMKVRRKVRIGYLASTNLKIIELPIGVNKEYSMVFALVVDNDASLIPSVGKWGNNTVIEVLEALKDNYEVIEVAIPKFRISSEIDVRDILEDLGVKRLWTDPGATRYISTPPARPGSYIQRATMTLSNKGIGAAPYEFPTNPTSDQERYWSEFKADRPFIFGLFDTETYTCLMATFYSKPTYPY